MQVETELLLTTAPAYLERLAAELIARATVASHRRATVYFDTPDLALGRRGVALRIRHDEKGLTRSIQQALPDQAGLHTRRFWDTAVSDETPDPDAVRDTLPPDAIAGVDLGLLRPVFRVDSTFRRVVVTPSAGTRIEVCLTSGTLSAAESESPLCEVRLKLREGTPTALFELALRFERRAPLRIEPRTRLDRGLALVRGDAGAPVKVPLPRAGPLMTSAEAFRALSFDCLRHMNANRNGLVAGEDPEYVHQMRVALRRLSSAFKVFSDLLPPSALQPPLADIRWLTQALGPLRDCDVFSDNVVTPLANQLQGHRGLAAMQRACGRRRDQLLRDATRAVNSRRYQRFMLGLSAWLTSDAWLTLVDPESARALRQPAERYAHGALARRHLRVLQRGRGLSHLSAAKLHRLRVAVKKLRYSAGCFSALYPDRPTGRLLGVLEDLQDALGGMNDCAVAERLIEETRAASRGAMLDDAEELLTSWNAAAYARHREALRLAWKTFRVTERFWDRTHEPHTVAPRGSRRHVARHGAKADRQGETTGPEAGRVARGGAAREEPRRRQRSAPRARDRAGAHGRV